MKYITIKQRSMNSISWQRRSQRLFQMLILSTIIMLIGGGIALRWASQQESSRSQAAGDASVFGPPTLAAATVDAIFARVGSPLVGSGKLVEQTSRQTNIDDAFALGVWWTETNDGEAGVGLADHNPGSVRGSVGYPSAFDGYTIYPSYTAAIVYWFNMLRNVYIGDRGLSTVYTIARPYVGTVNYPLWAGKVINLMYSYRGIAPPPVMTATPKAEPPINPGVVVAKMARQYQQHKLAQLLLLRSESNSVLPGVQGQAQEGGQRYDTGTLSANIPSVLPPPVNFAIVLCSLLAALAIALYSFKLKAGAQPVPSFGSGSPVDTFAPSTDDLPILPAFIRLPARENLLPGQKSSFRNDGFAPSTDDLPVLPVQVPAAPESWLPLQKRAIEARPRRVTLLSSSSSTEAQGSVVTSNAGAGSSGQAHSGGLLSRYGQNSSNLSI